MPLMKDFFELRKTVLEKIKIQALIEAPEYIQSAFKTMTDNVAESRDIRTYDVLDINPNDSMCAFESVEFDGLKEKILKYFNPTLKDVLDTLNTVHAYREHYIEGGPDNYLDIIRKLMEIIDITTKNCGWDCSIRRECPKDLILKESECINFAQILERLHGTYAFHE